MQSLETKQGNAEALNFHPSSRCRLLRCRPLVVSSAWERRAT